MLKSRTREYVDAFGRKDIEAVSRLITDDFALEDPVVQRIEGRAAVLEAIQGIFDSAKELRFIARNIFADGTVTVIEFELHLDDVRLTGVDLIEWEGDRMKELRAYLDVPKG